MDDFGGNEAVRSMGAFVRTPPPGKDAVVERLNAHADPLVKAGGSRRGDRALGQIRK